MKSRREEREIFDVYIIKRVERVHKMNVVVSISIKKPVLLNIMYTHTIISSFIFLFSFFHFKPPIYSHSSFSFFSFHAWFSSCAAHFYTNTDITRKTVKLMISISNKSNPITTNMSLISSEIMRYLHQHRMLIYWRATTIQPIPIPIDITIIIIDIRMPRQVRKVNILYIFFLHFN